MTNLYKDGQLRYNSCLCTNQTRNAIAEAERTGHNNSDACDGEIDGDHTYALSAFTLRKRETADRGREKKDGDERWGASGVDANE